MGEEVILKNQAAIENMTDIKPGCVKSQTSNS